MKFTTYVNCINTQTITYKLTQTQIAVEKMFDFENQYTKQKLHRVQDITRTV